MKRLALIVAAIVACVGIRGEARASVLGTAESFAVLGGSTVTNTGTTTVGGDLGVWPGPAVVGFPPGIVTGGSIHTSDAVAQTAQGDVTTAYTSLANMPFKTDLSGQDLGTGVYRFDTSAQLTGKLILDAQGNNNAYWVFQIGSTLTTASASSAQIINVGSNGGSDDGLFWQVGSSATLGTTTDFEGNILALASITLNNAATIHNGRALAQNGAVTMDTNTITIASPPPNNGPGLTGGLVFGTNGTIVPLGPSSGAVPEPSSFVLVAVGLTSLLAFKKRGRTARG
jgi:type VI secretion system secreted protein VgrG